MPQKNLSNKIESSINVLSYQERADKARNPILKKLFSIIERKKTNLAVAADVYTQQELFDLIQEIGPHICMLKLHIDCINDFDQGMLVRLQQKAQEYDFLLLEDGKFADIGSTMEAQLSGGLYAITTWADAVTVHAISGPGICDAVRSVCAKTTRPFGVLLLAQMSSKGNLIDERYTQAVINMMKEYEDIAIGVIGQDCSIDSQFIKATPGVNLESKGDALGQQYNTPESVVARGSDVIIVGRGIYRAQHKKEAAQKYQEAGWRGYCNRLKN